MTYQGNAGQDVVDLMAAWTRTNALLAARGSSDSTGSGNVSVRPAVVMLDVANTYLEHPVISWVTMATIALVVVLALVSLVVGGPRG